MAEVLGPSLVFLGRLADVREQVGHRPRSCGQQEAFQETVDGEDRWHDRARDGVRRCTAADAAVRRRGDDRLSTAGCDRTRLVYSQRLRETPVKLGRVLINARIAVPAFLGHNHRLSKK